MGFFSFNCKCCGHPMLQPCATEKLNKWMSDCIVITDDGSILMGEYDGYGRVGEHEPISPECGAWYHKACWNSCLTNGYTPMNQNANEKFGITQGPSDSASDQGWFFEDGVHDMEEPSPFTFLGGKFMKNQSTQHTILNPEGK
jgi:hypothetical protein